MTAFAKCRVKGLKAEEFLDKLEQWKNKKST